MAAGFACLLIIGLFFALYRVFGILDEHKTQLAKLRQPIVKGKVDAALGQQADLKAEQPNTEMVSQTNLPSPEVAKAPNASGDQVSTGNTSDPKEAKKTADISKNETRVPVKAIVKKDDTLFRMTVRVYGFSNERVMAFVKKNNPSIKDITHIEAGSTIVFPPLDESLEESRGR
jgi:nucleoid-associated protein YgaU